MKLTASDNASGEEVDNNLPRSQLLNHRTFKLITTEDYSLRTSAIHQLVPTLVPLLRLACLYPTRTHVRLVLTAHGQQPLKLFQQSHSVHQLTCQITKLLWDVSALQYKTASVTAHITWEEFLQTKLNSIAPPSTELPPLTTARTLTPKLCATTWLPSASGDQLMITLT